MIKCYREGVASMAYRLAREDPELVLSFIGKLRKSGEIEPDDLQHLERIARKWVRIARENRSKQPRRVSAAA